MDKPILPSDFHFSQSNLSDWRTCQRRFQYRHLERRPYPAPHTASEDILEYEHHLRQGEDFHRIVAQHLAGIDASLIEKRITDPVLQSWWENYQKSGLEDIPDNIRQVETILTAPIGNHRLLAKYDLLAADPASGRIIIVDWKTSRKRPKPETLTGSMQTIVYLYLAVKAASYYLDWEPVQPENVEMIYWFANYPNQPERIRYSAQRYVNDETLLGDLVKEIADETVFPKVDETAKDRICRYCEYRTLCWEDVTAGPLAEMDEDVAPPDDFDSDFSLDQIAEIEF